MEIRWNSTSATLSPTRGGMATAFIVDSRPIFFLDPTTLADPTKNVRGGNPVLFPTPGRLTGDAWARDGLSGALNQHGFARDRAWDVVSVTADVATLALDTPASPSYPWSSRIAITYRVGDRALVVTTHIENRGDTPMPFGLGFHPYFAVADKHSFALTSSATRAFDNVRKVDLAFDAATLDLTAGEVDLHLLDHGAERATFTADGLPAVTIDAPDFSRWVLWTLPGRPFVCVEPWTCPADALNTGEGLQWLAAGESRDYRVVFSAPSPTNR